MPEQIHNLISYSPGGILSKVLTKGGAMNITLFSMAKGTELTEHTSTKQAFIYVVEGDGIFTLAGKDIPMTNGVAITMEPNSVHAIQSKENTSFLLILANG